MSKKVLKDPTIIKIMFTYVDGKGVTIKELVRVHYLDDKCCFLVGSVPQNFSKPKWRAKGDIVVYTADGRHSAKVLIKDTSYTLSEVYYTIELPKEWLFEELRTVFRLAIPLPVKIKFSDDLVLETELHDLSATGFSIVGDYVFNTLQTRFPNDCTIIFPDLPWIDFPGPLLEVKSKYVRQQAMQDELKVTIGKIYGFQFLDMSEKQAEILKKFLDEVK